MSNDRVVFDQESEENPVTNGRSRAIVWNYFEKIIGDDGLPKTRCTKCKKVYNCPPKSGTSTMRRHLPKCFPQPLTQFSPNACPLTAVANSSDESPTEVRAAKKLKPVVEDNLRTKPERELQEFIWMTKRNIPLLEEKLPDKAIAIKVTLKCYEDELDRRANLRLNKSETEKAVIKFEMDDQSVAGNEKFNGNIAEEETAGRLQIVERHEDENQASGQQSTVSIIPEHIYAELKKVSSVLSMITSPHSFYTPHDNPLNQESEQAKNSLIELLNKDFESIVGSPFEQNVKSCIKILIKNLDKIPRFQARVIENLHSEFESLCQNWTTWRNNIHANISFEVQQRESLEVLQEWQEKDMEIESRIGEVDAEIARLKAELREKELTREGLVKEKAFMFDQSKMSIEEAKKVLEEMVNVKVQSDVALDKMKDVAAKWERMRNNFSSTPVTYE